MIFINTRPSQLGKSLTNKLRQYPVTVLDLPLLDFAPCPLTYQNHQNLMAINAYQAVILVSKIAVSYFLAWITKHNFIIEPNTPFVAVGRQTAQCFGRHFESLFGYLPNLFEPSAFGFSENNEGMLQLPIIKSRQQGDHVLIIKGVGGRALLKDMLKNNDIIVKEVSLYQRILPPNAEHDFEQVVQHFNPNTKTTVLISSAAIWKHWQHLLQNSALDMNDFDYIALQDRLSCHLSASGATHIKTVDNLSVKCIWRALGC